MNQNVPRAGSSLPQPRAVWLGRCDYQTVADAMHAFTARRDADTADELWCLEHDPVFTLGRAADPAHVLLAGDIPVLRSDRGGQVTYHGPGQLVIYPLLDLRRLGLGTRSLVEALELAIAELCAAHGIVAWGRRDAPGVYVEERKIASLGLRISRQCSLHGLALNVDMDLSPFARINPCGYRGLQMTQLVDEGLTMTTRAACAALLPHLCRQLNLPTAQLQPDDRFGGAET